jgi:sugar diacid utilization regulator
MAHHHPAVELDPHGRIPLRDLLAEPLLRGRVLTGGLGMDRPVCWCLPLSEVKESDRHDDPEETSDLAGVAVHLPMDALADDDAPELVAGLARRGAAVLLARQGPHGGTDIATAVRSALRSGLPLVELDRIADYRRVSRLVGQKALAQTSHVLEYGSHVHGTLAGVLSLGTGLPAMARAIHGLSLCDVLILDSDNAVLAAAGFRPKGRATPEEVTEMLAERLPDRSHPDTRSGGTGVIELDLRRESATLDPAGVTGAEGAHEEHAPVRVVLAPILVGGEMYGRLVLIEPDWPPNGHDSAQHRVIVEHGATLSGSEMLRQRSVQAAEEQARGDFIEALVHGRFADPHELRARARHHGFDVEARYAVHVVSSAALLAAGRPDLRPATAMTRIAHAVEPADDRHTLAATVGSMIVVIRQIPPTDAADPLAEQRSVTHFAERLHHTLRSRAGTDLRVTHGRPGKGAAGVAASYHEARMAMGLARRTGAAPVCGYDDLRVFAAIKDVAASVEGQSFACETMEALRRVHSQTGDLEQVVLAYIHAAGNLNAAARALKLHRNTMLYKLDRASRALRMDIRTAEAQFMVWLAHHIETLTSVTSALADEMSPPVEDVAGVA